MLGAVIPRRKCNRHAAGRLLFTSPAQIYRLLGIRNRSHYTRPSVRFYSGFDRDACTASDFRENGEHHFLYELTGVCISIPSGYVLRDSGLTGSSTDVSFNAAIPLPGL